MNWLFNTVSGLRLLQAICTLVMIWAGIYLIDQYVQSLIKQIKEPVPVESQLLE